MLNEETFKNLLQVIGEICLGFTYGITICYIFWKQDKAEFNKTSTLKRSIFFLAPVLISILTWFGPNYGRMKELMGFFFPIYSTSSSIFSLYPIPVFISILILIKLRRNPSRWVYASFPFLVGIVVIFYRLIQAFRMISEKS